MADENERNGLSLNAPTPQHFRLYGKATTGRWKRWEPGECDDPQLKNLYAYGMPRDRAIVLITIPGSLYGPLYSEFTVEFFGVEGPQPELSGGRQKQLGSVTIEVLDSPPAPNPADSPTGCEVGVWEDDRLLASLHGWRFRIYLNESPLCLESFLVDIWRARLLGIRFDDPVKGVPQFQQMAAAFDLINSFGLKSTRQREPGLSAEEFLTEGMAAAERIAGRDTNNLRIGDHASEMGISERSHLKYRELYPAEWKQIKQAFITRKKYRKDTWEHLQRSKNRKDTER
jgi:hypothetical protein